MNKLKDENYIRAGIIKNQEKSRKNAPVLCDECGARMFYPNPNTILPTYPVQKEVECECGYSAYLYCKESWW
jgi:hypothetical protein